MRVSFAPDHGCSLGKLRPSAHTHKCAWACSCADTNTHTHAHKPGLWISGMRVLPSPNKNLCKGKDSATLPGRGSQRLQAAELQCPGHGVFVLDWCRRLATVRSSWFHWEFRAQDSSPPLCLVGSVTLQWLLNLFVSAFSTEICCGYAKHPFCSNTVSPIS